MTGFLSGAGEPWSDPAAAYMRFPRDTLQRLCIDTREGVLRPFATVYCRPNLAHLSLAELRAQAAHLSFEWWPDGPTLTEDPMPHIAWTLRQGGAVIEAHETLAGLLRGRTPPGTAS